MNGAQAVIESLKKEGIKYVFGVPGTTIMHLIDALYDEPGIRYISVRHEQVASFMADGYARAFGEPAVCLASRGPGAANMTIGIHNAFAESIPMVAIIGQVADEIYYRDAFEEMDLKKFYEPITKWQVDIRKPERIPELVQRAVRTTVGGRPRPVLVSVPTDIQTEEIHPNFQKVYRQNHSVPSRSEIKNAVTLLKSAERPVMILGGGLLSGKGRNEVIEIANMLQIPVVTTWLRKDVFPNTHDLFFGSLGFGAPNITEQLVKEADVIVAVGCHFSEFTTKRWSLISPNSKLIHIDIDHEEIGKMYVPEIGLVGDAQQTLEVMLDIVTNEEEINGLKSDKRVNRLITLRREYLAETKLPKIDKLIPGKVPSQAVIEALKEILKKYSSIIVQDAACFGVWIHRFLSFNKPNTYYAAAGGSLGWGLPAAMGLKLARPDQHIINVTGDGAFWMVAQDLETAVRERIPIINIIMNNFAYGNTRDRQKSTHNERYFGVFYGNPDFAAFAELLGAHGERVEHPKDVLPAIKRAIASGKPAVIDVIQDSQEGPPPGILPPTSK